MNNTIRKCRMRQLLNLITTDETDCLQSISVVKDVILQLKQIDEESNADEVIKQVDETFMDARIFHAATHVAYKCIQNVDYTQQTFNVDDFADKLQHFLTNGQPDEFSVEHLYSIDQHVNLDSVMPTLSSYSSLSGAKVIQAVHQPKERIAKNLNAAKTTKKKLIKVTDLEKNEAKSDDILRYYMKALSEEYKSNQNTPVDYFEFVIDTNDFGVTVENIFYTSFNINDGKMHLMIEDDVPTLQPIDKKARLELSQTTAVQKHQFVTSIDMAMWQEKCVHIQEGIVQKHRQLGTFSKH